jgi:single-strand DNA-binding protein
MRELENLMTDTISLTGLVATVPEHRRIRDDVELTSFRLASSQRYFDRNSQTWVAGETNWYTVSTFRHLASNVRESVHKGDRVVVMGRLRVRRWENGEKNGTAIEVDAENIGHDLAWGVASYVRTPARETAGAAEQGSQERDGTRTFATSVAESAVSDHAVPGMPVPNDATVPDRTAPDATEPASTVSDGTPEPVQNPSGPSGWTGDWNVTLPGRPVASDDDVDRAAAASVDERELAAMRHDTSL